MSINKYLLIIIIYFLLIPVSVTCNTIEKAELLWKNGNLREAEKVFKTLNKETPLNRFILTGLGEISRVLGNYEESFNCFNKLTDNFKFEKRIIYLCYCLDLSLRLNRKEISESIFNEISNSEKLLKNYEYIVNNITQPKQFLEFIFSRSVKSGKNLLKLYTAINMVKNGYETEKIFSRENFSHKLKSDEIRLLYLEFASQRYIMDADLILKILGNEVIEDPILNEFMKIRDIHGNNFEIFHKELVRMKSNHPHNLFVLNVLRRLNSENKTSDSFKLKNFKLNDLKTEELFSKLFSEKKYNILLKQYSELNSPVKNDPKLLFLKMKCELLTDRITAARETADQILYLTDNLTETRKLFFENYSLSYPSIYTIIASSYLIKNNLQGVRKMFILLLDKTNPDKIKDELNHIKTIMKIIKFEIILKKILIGESVKISALLKNIDSKDSMQSLKKFLEKEKEINNFLFKLLIRDYYR